MNVTFDFPPVQPDYGRPAATFADIRRCDGCMSLSGSLGQGDLTPTTLEGRPASKLSFYGMAVYLAGTFFSTTFCHHVQLAVC